MTRPVRIALITSFLTGVILAIPSYCLAEVVLSPSGGEVVARWLALSLTAFGMVGSGGIAYGVTKATLGTVRTDLAKHEKLLEKIFTSLEVRPTIEDWKDRRTLEDRVHAVELGSVKEALDALRREFIDFRKMLGDRRAGE